MDKRSEITGILLLPALAIAYYFAIALPENQRARLSFEKQKYEDEQKQRVKEQEDRAAQEQKRSEDLEVCLSGVSDTYWSYIKLNGKPVPGKEGTYTALRTVWDKADKEKQIAMEECHRRYGK